MDDDKETNHELNESLFSDDLFKPPAEDQEEEKPRKNDLLLEDVDKTVPPVREEPPPHEVAIPAPPPVKEPEYVFTWRSYVLFLVGVLLGSILTLIIAFPKGRFTGGSPATVFSPVPPAASPQEPAAAKAQQLPAQLQPPPPKPQDVASVAPSGAPPIGHYSLQLGSFDSLKTLRAAQKKTSRIGLDTVVDTSITKNDVLYVRGGSFSLNSEAQAAALKLKVLGFDSTVDLTDSGFTLKSGPFTSITKAMGLKQQMDKMGFPARVSQDVQQKKVYNLKAARLLTKEEADNAHTDLKNMGFSPTIVEAQ